MYCREQLFIQNSVRLWIFHVAASVTTKPLTLIKNMRLTPSLGFKPTAMHECISQIETGARRHAGLGSSASANVASIETRIKR